MLPVLSLLNLSQFNYRKASKLIEVLCEDGSLLKQVRTKLFLQQSQLPSWEFSSKVNQGGFSVVCWVFCCCWFYFLLFLKQLITQQHSFSISYMGYLQNKSIANAKSQQEPQVNLTGHRCCIMFSLRVGLVGGSAKIINCCKFGRLIYTHD